MSPFDAYTAIEAVNFSSLKYMKTSPLKYKHVLDNGVDDTVLFGIGRAIHCATLQPERLELDFAVFDGKRRQGKAWDAFEAEHADKTILRRDEWDDALATAKKVMENPIASEWLNLSKALIERPITWRDEATGLLCKGRPDAVHSAVVDMKSTATIDGRIFLSQATRLGYFGQLAFYRRGYRALTKMNLPCAIVAVELDAPHDVGVFVVDEDSLRVADEEITRLLAKVAECRKSGKWPGRYDKAQSLVMPDWARGEKDFNLWEAA